MSDQVKFALLDFLQDQAWAISESMLDQIFQVVHAKYFGSGINISEIEARTGKELKNTYSSSIRSNVLLLPAHGIVGKRMNLMSAYSGGVSTDLLKRDIAKGLKDPEVDAIVIDADSPGGTITGVKELVDYIHSVRGQKPIIAHANERALSAMYWVVSAADKVYASETANVGSIGVYTRHYDYSKWLEKEGIKPTYIYAGKYKTMGNPEEPLGGRERNIIQGEIDTLYTMFVDSVARNRNISKDAIQRDALSLLAAPALERGLIDGIMTLDEAIQEAASMAAEKKQTKREDEFYGSALTLDTKLDTLIAKYA